MDIHMMTIAGKHFQLIRKDMGELARIKGKGMRFETETYEAENAGTLCVIIMKAMAGMMKMETATFTPSMYDGPILSLDWIHAMGNETLVLELYGTTLSEQPFDELSEVKSRYSDLPAYEPEKTWYTDLLLPASGHYKGRKIRDRLDTFIQEYCEVYFDKLITCPPCDPARKNAKNAILPDGLLANGGPAVNQFKSMIGEEKTAEFMKKYMFCCE